MKTRILAVLVSILGFGGVAFGQTPAPLPDAPKAQHFILSANAAGYGGQSGTSAVSIASAGFQLTEYISIAATSISDPTDSKQPRYSMGDVNVTYELGSLLPSALKKKLVFDTTNYLVTFQGSVGKVTAPTFNRIAEGVGVYLSRPIGNHIQASCGYRALFPGHVLVKIPLTAGLNVTF